MKQWETLERQVLAERQIVATLMAAGAKDLTFPTLETAREDFDAALSAPPVVRVLDRRQLILRRALGVV